MTTSLLLLAMLQATAGAPAAGTPIEFKPNAGDWGLLSVASGTLSTASDGVTIALETHAITANPIHPNERKIVGYTVCLAHLNADGVFDTTECAPRQKHKATLSSGQSEAVGPATFTIPVEPDVALADYWLVLRIQLSQPGGRVGYAYSDSPKGIFAKPAP